MPQQSHQQSLEDIARHHAIAGWGTKPGWRAVWAETCAPDMVLHFCGMAEPITGLEPICDFTAELFQGFPDLEQTIEGFCASGNDVAYRHRLTGRHAGPFLGLAPTGRQVEMTGMTWLRLHDGKIAEEWYELNHDELKRQLNLL